MIGSFQKNRLPEDTKPIGLSWLVEYFNLTLPLRDLSSISDKRLAQQKIQKGIWRVFDIQFSIDEYPFSHLAFSIKHEKLDLLVLKYILKAFPKEELTKNINSNPKKVLHKKIWFYYEFLLESRLELDDLPVGRYDTLLDEKKYIVSKQPIKSKRHKLNINLLGTSKMSPIIIKTPTLQAYMDLDLKNDISSVIAKVSPSLVQRASSFLLLADSRASFEIEGERVSQNRIENWGKIINEAGKTALSIVELERLHSILLKDSRFIQIGLRTNEVFLGDRDRDYFPIPEFIGAKSENLKVLIEALIALDKILEEIELDPVLHAVIIAFAFVYIHPLEDGNGRIHRYLIHHVLAQRDFYPKGMIFPISSVILDEISNYRDILVSHTSPLMSMIEWKSSLKGNVEILNDTSDLYRFFDCTQSCEFIYKLVDKTIKETLPNELKYLDTFDRAYSAIYAMIEMPNNQIKQLITFILQNNGRLSKKKKEKYYDKLTPQEVEEIEDIVSSVFDI